MAMLILMLVILMLILMLLNLNTGHADLCVRIVSLCCISVYQPYFCLLIFLLLHHFEVE